MLSSKKMLSLEEASKLYKERLSERDGQFFFDDGRRFTEYLGAQVYNRELKVISKGWYHTVHLCFPMYIPEPRNEMDLNWFQVALNKPESLLPDLFGCPARYKGFLPGYLQIGETRMSNSFTKPECIVSTFHLVDDLEQDAKADYVLYIYDRADYSTFIDKLQDYLGRKYVDDGLKEVTDSQGRKILVSDSATDQSMVLIPMEFFIGGKEFIMRAWNALLEG